MTTEVKQERSADKAKLTVVDLREDGVPRKNIGGRTSSSRSQERQESGEIELTRLLQSKRTDQGLQNQNGGSQFQGRERNEASFSEIMVNLRGGGESLGSTGDTKAASMPDFQGRLLQQLREHLNGDIVKRGSIVVKDNGAGEIKLDLKPAELGQVRIRLSLENNNIAGRIFVENSSVKEAFDQNLQQLYRAFKEQGFDGASLNVTVGDHRRKQQQNGAGGFMLTQGNTASSGVGTTAAPRLSARVEDRLVDVMA
ncbi:MAG TPA: flagellar hook-length control protein FliK [Sediminispirochaeta sp.]|nr:flagellar hook-length control protein FliK [Sediminispirochaeta sp.]